MSNLTDDPHIAREYLKSIASEPKVADGAANHGRFHASKKGELSDFPEHCSVRSSLHPKETYICLCVHWVLVVHLAEFMNAFPDRFSPKDHPEHVGNELDRAISSGEFKSWMEQFHRFQ